jgi:diadenosine tetraphosphate (Ap4A) HIT family hydrolase
MNVDCPFCSLIKSDDKSRVVKESSNAVAIKDGYPITKGHSLIIPKRHIQSFFDTTELERQQLLALIDEVKADIDGEFSPDAYNIGINDGPAAGQTVRHLHIHLIPRYEGDIVDPRGGVRWVIPDKAVYWDINK